MKITHLRANHLQNPLGYVLFPLSLSWQVEDAGGERTETARVEIGLDAAFREIVFDSGRKSGLNPLGYCPELTLEARTRYYWRVSVWDDTREMAVSEAAFFETAPEQIRGKWITAPFDKHLHGVYRKVFETESDGGKSIERARLYITGLGLYEAYLDGKKIGNEYLTPFYNDYANWVQFQSYDVTDMLQKGGNALYVLLGDGWYKGRFGFIDKMARIYGDTQKLLCELEIVYSDGSRQSVGSDESFMCKPSPVRSSSIYDGEVYDARRAPEGVQLPMAQETDDACTDGKNAAAQEEDDWTSAVAAEAPAGILSARRSLPLTLHEAFQPVEVIRTSAGETVLDFGQNLSGIFTFVCREPSDAEVRLQFGEILQDGNFYNENLRTAKAEYRYISDGAVRMVRPHFTFYGFRYMKVEGISELQPEDFTVYALYSEMEETGRIETSNPKVNRLIQNALWGQKSNFVDVPTDCPQRDERMGWTGDAQVFCATASYNMYTPAFYEKYLYDMLAEQKELGGAVPHVVPDILNRINEALADPVRAKELGLPVRNSSEQKKEAGSCAWGDAATVIPWTLYVFYGDKRLLAQEYENMKRWVEYIYRIDEEKCGGQRLWQYGFHFADWLALDNFHKGSSLGGTDPYYVASVYYFYSASLTAKAASVLGEKEDAARYEKLAREIKEAIQREYFTPAGRIAVDTQTAMVLALYFDIVPAFAKERLVKALRSKLEEENIHLTTGFVGTPYLCPALTENGLAGYAYTLLLNEDFPSWLYEVNMGATTIWERWNSVLPDGRISDTGMNSLNHYAYGSIVEWIYRYIGGLNPSEKEPGFRNFTVKPYPDARFEYADISYRSACGLIRSAWKREERAWAFTVEVPFDTTAQFMLPEKLRENAGNVILVNGKENKLLLETGKLTLRPGKYEIRVSR